MGRRAAADHRTAAGNWMTTRQRLETLQRLGRQATIVAAMSWLIFGVLHHGYRLQWVRGQDALHIAADACVVAAYAFGIVVRFLLFRQEGKSARRFWIDLLFLVFSLFLSWTLHAGTAAVILRRAQGGFVLLAATPWGRRYVTALARRPALVMVLSFAVTIAVGTLLLTFAAATEDGGGAPFLTAFFTATSATCVTGLIVVDTPAYFSLFGELVILGLIQVGGLGIMTLSAALFVLMGRRLTARQRRVLSSVLDETGLRDVGVLVQNIFQTTMIIEGLGALLLFVRWYGDFASIAETAYMSIFHSVSAFCNAGFSLLSLNLMDYVADPVVNLVMALLIVLGGLGFTVLSDLYAHRSLRRRGPGLSTHTRVVLLTSAALILVGGIALFYFEYAHSLAPYSVPVKLQAAFFQSVSARTAGFNSIDMTRITPVAALVFTALMFIGGSPGGTAGGIKTSTFALLVLSVRTIIRGREEIEVFGRSISKENLHRALAVSMASFGIVFVAFTWLLASQAVDYVSLLFESVSAFGTVGLSMGATAQLTAFGKVLIIALMFAGRVGPLSLALAVGEEMERLVYRYPTTKLLVG
jgi:trk system potassium uptake protein TrkH